jgi:hypothetical protein
VILEPFKDFQSRSNRGSNQDGTELGGGVVDVIGDIGGTAWDITESIGGTAWDITESIVGRQQKLQKTRLKA